LKNEKLSRNEGNRITRIPFGDFFFNLLLKTFEAEYVCRVVSGAVRYTSAFYFDCIGDLRFRAAPTALRIINKTGKEA